MSPGPSAGTSLDPHGLHGSDGLGLRLATASEGVRRALVQLSVSGASTAISHHSHRGAIGEGPGHRIEGASSGPGSSSRSCLGDDRYSASTAVSPGSYLMQAALNLLSLLAGDAEAHGATPVLTEGGRQVLPSSGRAPAGGAVDMNVVVHTLKLLRGLVQSSSGPDLLLSLTYLSSSSSGATSSSSTGSGSNVDISGSSLGSECYGQALVQVLGRLHVRLVIPVLGREAGSESTSLLDGDVVGGLMGGLLADALSLMSGETQAQVSSVPALLFVKRIPSQHVSPPLSRCLEIT